ncbi:DUF2162 domain-containing protein [Desulforhopalus singaporensis]|uniref:Predicted transporter n=1 Tax=Desulforhopalus singaporensis TaxID=91360 RepID=A0A1H0SJS3_9BACT|nr:DUF2162 domain-containing protein [Desulforhopalus singaporensis]SDP41406.1 Predicted transporter [Desulforhopalus singaporensis]
MVLKSLILGVLFSVGIFAVKSGVGLSYCFAGSARTRSKIGACSLFVMTYLAVFASAVLVLQHVDLVRHLDLIQRWLRSGMLGHLVIAALMIGWGLLLLTKNDGSIGKSRGWLILAMPCPVCLTVILLSAAVLLSYFPEHLYLTAALFYLAFMAISLLTPVAVHLLRKRSPMEPDGFLGSTMLLMAAYFLLSAIIMPQFGDLDKIYRMACYRSDTLSADVAGAVNVTLLTAAAFLAGYSLTIKRIRSYQ